MTTHIALHGGQIASALNYLKQQAKLFCAKAAAVKHRNYDSIAAGESLIAKIMIYLNISNV